MLDAVLASIGAEAERRAHLGPENPESLATAVRVYHALEVAQEVNHG